MSVVQGRKPGWLLDKILGREAEPAGDATSAKRPATPTAEATPALETSAPPPLSPASLSEGRPDFTPAALESVPLATPAPASAPAAPPPAPPSVTEASPDTPGARKVPEELAGASLQPVEPAAAAPPSAIAPRPAEPIRIAPPAPPAAAGPLVPAGSPAPAGPAAEPRRGWFRRLADGMRRTSSSIGDSVTGLFTKRRLDRAMLDELEDVLIAADLGLDVALRITEAVAAGRYDREIAPDEVRAIMAAEVEKALVPVAKPLVIDPRRKPFVLLMVGVNGAGKTTTIGKLAQKFRAAGQSVMIAAGDTFRAAAIEQLKVWGERTGAPVVARAQGSDAAGLAFDALQEARAAGTDILMIDTAGRLQNKAGLMDELTKIIRVMRKLDPEAPHAVLLVLDATVGQNALSQVELFGKTAGVTGLVMTKLDGTARGGILVALAAKFGLPVHFIGIGEGVDDLEPFAARDFARAIAGLDEAA